MDQTQEDDKLKQAVFDGLVEMVRATSWSRWRDTFFEQHWAKKREAARNPLLKCGNKYFSQNDEDGILREICRRMNLERGVFLEIGVGDGLENNTLLLLMSGWEGVWLGGQKLAFEVPDHGPLVFQQAWITKENCRSLVEHGLAALGTQKVNLLSVDLDGNDLHVIEALLAAGIAPDILVAEYNAKFPPPIRWTIGYDPEHGWDGSDYFGCSLQSLVDALAPQGYRLIACNLTGINAFFVKNEHSARFDDIPVAVVELFMDADYNWFVCRGHPTSPRTVARFLQSAAAT